MGSCDLPEMYAHVTTIKYIITALKGYVYYNKQYAKLQ